MQNRKFQQEARYLINRHLNAGKNPVFVSDTGTGKTYVACQVIADRIKLKERVFVLTPQEEIFSQWLIELEKQGIDYGYINSSGVMGRNKRIYVCMPLTLNNILSVLPASFKPDVIFIDECHHSEAATWKNIFSFFAPVRRVGFTATLQRTDGMGFEETFDSIVRTIEMQEAIGMGFLSKPVVIVPEQYKMDVSIQNGDYDPEEQAVLLGKTRIIGNVIKKYKTVFNGLPILVACSTFEHAKKMTEEFCKSGWKFEHIHSKLPTADRKAMLRKIRTGKLNGLCTVGIGIEGMDIPGLYGLIWLRRTKSLTIYMQFIGRILRKAAGKIYGIVIDPVGNVFIHGVPEMEREHTLKGKNDNRKIEEYPAPKMKVCPICSVMNAEINIFCHICKHDFRETLPPGAGRKLPIMVDGELVFLEDYNLGDTDDLYSDTPEEDTAPYIAHAGQDAGQETHADTQPETPINAEEALSEPTITDKLTLLKTGLERKKGVFAKAVRGYL